MDSSKKNCQYYTRYRCCPFETECLYLHDKRARWMSPVSTVPVGESMSPFRLTVYWLFNCPAEQCPTEDDDDYVVDPLNLLLALTLLGGDTDDDEEDSLDFPFYLSVEYNLWISFLFMPKTSKWSTNCPLNRTDGMYWNVTQVIMEDQCDYRQELLKLQSSKPKIFLATAHVEVLYIFGSALHLSWCFEM